MSFTPNPDIPLRKFVSEKDIEEGRLENGDRQRKEEVNDGRPLWEKLKENKAKADEAFQERIRFRPPRALDDDDVSFLESKEREKIERLIRNEEQVQKELIEFRKAQRITTADSPTLLITPKPKPSLNNSNALKVKVIPIPKSSSSKRKETDSGKYENDNKIQGTQDKKANGHVDNHNTIQETKEKGEHMDKKLKQNPLPTLVEYEDNESD